jgi:hypothetical protein
VYSAFAIPPRPEAVVRYDMEEGILTGGCAWRSAIYSDFSTLVYCCCCCCSTNSIHSLLISELDDGSKKDEVEFNVCCDGVDVVGYGD